MTIPHNIDVLHRNPRIPIPNQGVSKVGRPVSRADWDVLRFELQHFVCEGEYAKGLDRILSAYLGNQGGADQVGAWVSGFYGSGKSHFVRVLDALWADLVFPQDGAAARALVPSLPPDIDAGLHELTSRGRATGGVWGASGVLSGGAPSFRMAVLEVLFTSAGLPAGYGPAKLALWLKREGIEQQVREALEGLGTSLETEFFDLYVSTELAEAVRAAKPGFAGSADAALEAFGRQFPNVGDVTEHEMMATVRELLGTVPTMSAATHGHRALPATLIVLDEVQQYIGDHNARALDVQMVAERFQRDFDAQVLLVCTGQAALQDTPQLQKLHGRFGVKVQLRTTDVEEVVRRVVLLKKPDGAALVERALDAVSGEIDRHLAGSRLAPRPEDRPDLVPDYPLLPTRRRFWEEVLRAVDNTGQGGQLRSQLQVTQEATALVADQPLGWVIPGDAIFDRLMMTMLQTGILLPSMDNLIADEVRRDPLKGRILKTVFLIGQLPTTGAAPSGLRADADHVADLLVEDLNADSGPFRTRVRAALEELAEASILMAVDGHYRLQTEEGQAWDQEFRNRATQFLNDVPRIANDRSLVLKQALAGRVKDIKLLHGASKAKRDFATHFGAEPPVAAEAIPVWVRDQWTASDKTVRDDAAREGIDSSTVHVFLPSEGHAEDLKLALARTAAARATLDARPNPSTPEGQEARRGMQGRLEEEQRKLDLAIAQIVDNARVYQGGGTQVNATSVGDAVRQALEASLSRRFPDFTRDADDPKWATVVERARSGADENPIKAVGWERGVADHPVIREVLQELQRGQKTGLAIRKKFQAAPYGWPQDTIDGALLALLRDGAIRATYNGRPRAPKDLIPTQIGQTEFASESETVTTQQRLQLKQLLANTGGANVHGSEGEVQDLLRRLRDLAEQTSGAAPLPANPNLLLLDELATRQGNGLLLAVHAQRETLLRWWNDWNALKEKIPARSTKWDRLQEFLRYAGPLGPTHDAVQAQTEAIRQHRTLLADPDPVSPLLTQLTDALRSAVREAWQQERKTHGDLSRAQSGLDDAQELSNDDWKAIYHRHSLGPVLEPSVGTDDQLLGELRDRPLTTRANRIAALPRLFDQARLDAVTLAEERRGSDGGAPKIVAVTPPQATLRTESEVDQYLQTFRAQLVEHIAAGNTVVI